MKEMISIKQLREFGLLIGFGFPLIIGWMIPSLFGHEFRAWSLYVGISGVMLGIISPHLLRYPYKCWMALGILLGKINSYIILGLVYIIVLQPIAFCMRLTGYDPLRRRRNGEKSYREIKGTHHTDLTRIF